ncbi:MAG TPA: hypothetical protein VLH35_04540, partial [Candidatus Acidoferrales bacterium]|nr:hypothetical protein [Candidatus Acidoferrales bacterium]
MVNPAAIDKENEQFFIEQQAATKKGSLTIGDILGFEIKESTTFVSRSDCGIIFSPKICPATGMSLFSLLPLYDSILYPVLHFAEGKAITPSNFKEYNGLSYEDFVKLVYKRKVVPYFTQLYSKYDNELITPLLETGLPRISFYHLELVKYQGMCKKLKNCEYCKTLYNQVMQD